MAVAFIRSHSRRRRPRDAVARAVLAAAVVACIVLVVLRVVAYPLPPLPPTAAPSREGGRPPAAPERTLPSGGSEGTRLPKPQPKPQPLPVCREGAVAFEASWPHHNHPAHGVVLKASLVRPERGASVADVTGRFRFLWEDAVGVAHSVVPKGVGDAVAIGRLGAGYHCVAVVDQERRCAVTPKEAILSAPERHSTEYAVAPRPWSPPPADTLIPATATAARSDGDVPLRLEAPDGASVGVRYPAVVPAGLPVPVVFQQSTPVAAAGRVRVQSGGRTVADLYATRGVSLLFPADGDRLLSPDSRAPGDFRHELASSGGEPSHVRLDVEGTDGSIAVVRSEALPLQRFTTVSQPRDSIGTRGLRSKPGACAFHVTRSISVAEVALHEGCVVALDPGVVLTVTSSLTVDGTAATPVLFTAARPHAANGGVGAEFQGRAPGLHDQRRAAGLAAKARWGGVVVGPAATATVRHAVFMFSGGSRVRVAGTGSHHRETPALTAAPGATLQCTDVTVCFASGPGFGVGEGAAVDLTRSLLFDVTQGLESVGGKVAVGRSHVLHVPLRPAGDAARFVDDDNDALYFRGGTAAVTDSVVAFTQDDGIDSASSKGGAAAQRSSTLTIERSTVAYVLHEGLALSGSEGTTRHVTVEDTLFYECQNGVENGYTPPGHRAVLRRVTFARCGTGVRDGDNYRKRVLGTVNVTAAAFRDNAMDVLSALRHDVAPTLGGSPSHAAHPFRHPRVTVANSVFEAGRGPTTNDPLAGTRCGRRHFMSSGNSVGAGVDAGCRHVPLCRPGE